MKKSLLIVMFASALSGMVLKTNFLQAQKLTVPDYSFGMVYSEQGRVSQTGVAIPGPYGGYSVGEKARPSGILLGKGYRWWGYPSAHILICGDLPEFNFPGNHGVWEMLLPCINPPTGYMASWGGVITDPANQKIWCLAGAKNHNGPTAQYCIKNPFGSGQICYPPPSIWGNGSAYGYLRKVVVVKSTGLLQKGDPVNIKVSVTAVRNHDGAGTASSMAVLFMNKLSQTPWYQGGVGKEYLTWHDIQDYSGIPNIMKNILARLLIDLNNSDDTTVTVAIGDTIVVDAGFNNTIKHNNPFGIGEAEGWAGGRPANLFSSMDYARTDSVRNLIKRYGNSFAYDLISLTLGAVLEPLTAGGPNVDGDNDGISDTREKGVDGNNSTFDGNNDGIPDCKQGNVASFQTYNGQNYVTMIVPLGTELSQLIVTDNPSPKDTPVNAEFPYGFFDFSIDGLVPGAAVTVTLILHNAEPVGKYYKYSPTPDNQAPHWYEFMYDGQTGAKINGHVISLHFVDGLRGDEDITVNGTIKEPGGPAKSGTTGSESVVVPASINIYPNPAYDRITLDLGNVEPGNNYKLMIFSNNGIKVKEENIVLSGSDMEFVVSTSQLPYGIYMVTLSGNNYIYKGKFVKIK